MSSSAQTTTDEKDDVARKLAAAHRRVDPDIVGVYRIESPGREADPNEPIKLLEVTPSTVPSGILPIGFGPHPPSGVNYSSVIVEIHPVELEQIRAGALPLPNGWVAQLTTDLSGS